MLSNKRENFSAGGGLLNDVDVTIVAAKAGMFTYPSGQSTVAALITYQAADGREEEAMYSAGSPDLIEPTKDGKGFDAVKKRADGKPPISQLPGSSNWSHFIEELEEAGFDGSQANFDEDITTLVGTQGHVCRIPQKDRGNLKNDDDKPKKKGEILVFNKVTKSGGGLAGAKASAGKQASAGSNGAELDELAKSAVLLAMDDVKAAMDRKAFATIVYNKVLEVDADKKTMRAPVRHLVLSSDDFLSQMAAEGILEFDGEKVSPV